MTGFKSKRAAALDEEGMYLVHHTAQELTLQEQLVIASANWFNAEAEINKAEAYWDKVDAEWDKADAEWIKAEVAWDKAKAEWDKAYAEIDRIEKLMEQQND